MKRNLFAILLAVTLVVAVVIVAAPASRAESNIIVAEEGKTYEITENGKTLNLNGQKDVKVNIGEGFELSVIDTANGELDGSTAGTLTKTGLGTIAPVAFDGNYRYLAVEENGTYSFHPFNLTISAIGINTIGEDICVRVTFVANNIVRDKMLGDYGIEILTGDNADEIPANEYYSFEGKNFLHAYYDLDGSLASDEKLDTTKQVRAYMVVGGQKVVSNYAPEITPRQVLKDLNNSDTVAKATENQKNAINTLAGNSHLADLFTSFTNQGCGHSAMTDATCVKASTCKNCDTYTVGTVDLLHGHNITDDDRFCHDCNGIEGDNSNNAMTQVALPGTSASWEISGQMVRPTNDIDGWNFGFDITSGGRALTFSAVNQGMVFEPANDHSRYPFHAFSLSQYNLNTAGVSQFVGNSTKGVMYFRAMIVEDVFYTWFWFDDPNGTPVLSWVIPLAETLTGNFNHATSTWSGYVDKSQPTARPFTGFAPGSEYSVGIHINKTSGSGSFTNLDIKTGEEVDTTKIPEYTASIVTGTADANGDVSILNNAVTSIKFGGNSTSWEVSGAIERNGTTELCPGFNIRAGGKSLRISATTRGPVFENHSGHGRYVYHAIIPNGSTTQYVKSTLNQHKFTSSMEESKMYFKAVILNDVFYVWFWFEGEDPVLAWEIPLAKSIEFVPGATGASAVWENPFTGFEAGSSYTFELFNNSADGSTGTFSDITVKTGLKAPQYVATSTNGVNIAEDGTVNSIKTTDGTIALAGNSNVWEMSGTMNRYTDDTQAWTFGFIIQSGSQSLNIAAATRGCMFIANEPNHSYYGWHAIANDINLKSQYNFNTDVEQFLNDGNFSTVKFTEKNKMHFKAIIVDNVFYVWYWFEGENPTLSWKIPLTETLTKYGSYGDWTNPFTGFTGDGNYSVSMYIRNSTSIGGIADLNVKTGDYADTSWVDALNATPAA